MIGCELIAGLDTCAAVPVRRPVLSLLYQRVWQDTAAGCHPRTGGSGHHTAWAGSMRLPGLPVLGSVTRRIGQDSRPRYSMQTARNHRSMKYGTHSLIVK